MNNVIENLQRVTAGARAKGIPVFFDQMAYTEEDYANEHLHKRSGLTG
jgi:nicotinamidase-related amidase